MSIGAILEVAVAVAMVGAGAWAWRRGGSQGAVILLVVAAIILIHGLGLMEYRPSPAELGR
jgi:hypothetical protein